MRITCCFSGTINTVPLHIIIQTNRIWRSKKLLSVDLIIFGDNSITICNTRSIILLVDMRQPSVGVVIEGDVDYLLGLGPLLVGGVSCLLDRQRTLPNNSGF